MSKNSTNPYESPTPGADKDAPASRNTKDRIARIIVLAALVYTAVYVPYFLLQMYRTSHGVVVSPLAIFPAHFIGMALKFAALILTVRDLYLRPFPNPNSKLTWLLLILMTGGVGWIIYILKYALKPRNGQKIA